MDILLKEHQYHWNQSNTIKNVGVNVTLMLVSQLLYSMLCSLKNHIFINKKILRQLSWEESCKVESVDAIVSLVKYVTLREWIE